MFITSKSIVPAQAEHKSVWGDRCFRVCFRVDQRIAQAVLKTHSSY
jgi:hypothetical protein